MKGADCPLIFGNSQVQIGAYSFDFRLSTISIRRSFGRMASVTITENTMVNRNAMIKLAAWMSRPNMT